MIELYIHNLILVDMKFFDPNSRMGDVQLMELASSLTHEEARVKEAKGAIFKESN